MNSERTEAHVKELYGMMRAYEAELLITSDPEELHWLRRIIMHLRAATIELENNDPD